MRKALAIARVTFAESLRRKTLAALAILWVLLVVYTLAQPGAKIEDRVQFAYAQIVGKTALFAVVLAIILGSTSIPRDIEDKKVFTILTKPIRVWDYYLGKVLGFAAFLALFLAGTVIFASAWIAIAFRELTPQQKDLYFYARHREPAATLETRSAGDAPPERAADPSAVLTVGGDHPRAAWSFDDLDPARLPPGPISGEIQVEFQPTNRRIRPLERATFRLTLVNPATGKSEQILRDSANRHVVEFQFPRHVLDAPGRLELVLDLDANEYLFSVTPRGVWLHSSRIPYAANFAKAMSAIYLEALLVLSVALASSSILSGPVAILLSSVAYLLGNILDLLRSFAAQLAAAQGVRDIWETISEGRIRVRPRAGGEPASPLFSTVGEIIEFACGIFPDFSKFAVSREVADRVSLAADRLAALTLYAGIYVGIFTLAGWFLVATTDVERREGFLLRACAWRRRRASRRRTVGQE